MTDNFRKEQSCWDDHVLEVDKLTLPKRTVVKYGIATWGTRQGTAFGAKSIWVFSQ